MKTWRIREQQFLLLTALVLIFGATAGFAQIFGDPYLTKRPLGPDGTPRAHIGDVITNTIRFRNLDDFNDSLVVTNIVDIIHHNSGSVTTSNLLSSPVVLPNFGDFVTLTNAYPVLPGDGPVLTDNAQAGGIDNHDGDNGTHIPTYVFATFPGQIRVLAPRIHVTQNCVVTCASNTPGLMCNGSVSNAGSFNTTLTNVVIVSDNGTSGNTNDDPILFIGTLTNGQTAAFSNVYALPGHTIINAITVRGTDELGFTVRDTNQFVVPLGTPVPVAAPGIVRPGYLRLKWVSEIGASYQIRAKTEVDACVWTNLPFLIPATATNTMVDVPLSGTAQFFRVVNAD